MKKNYEKPTLEVVDVEMECLLAGSGTVESETGGAGANPGENTESGTGGMAKEHFGIWD